MAETKENVEAACDLFIITYEDKYPGTAQCLLKDQDELLTFHDFPAAHWQSKCTTNPIESTFATIRYRAKRFCGCVSGTSVSHKISKLNQRAQNREHRSRGIDLLANVIAGAKFKDGIEVKTAGQAAAWFNLLNTKIDNCRLSNMLAILILTTGASCSYFIVNIERPVVS